MAAIKLSEPTEIQFEAARAYIAAKPAPSAMKVRLEKNGGELDGEIDRDWVFGLLEASDLAAEDEDLMRAFRERATKKRSWLASLMASFGI